MFCCCVGSQVLNRPPTPPPAAAPESNSDTTISSEYSEQSSPEPSSGDDAIVANVASRVDALRRNPELSIKEEEELEAMLRLSEREVRGGVGWGVRNTVMCVPASTPSPILLVGSPSSTS